MATEFETLPRGKLPMLYKYTGRAPIEWEIWVVKEGRSGVMVTCFGKQDGKKRILRDTITEGKNAGRKNATTAVEQAIAEAVSRWEKQKSRKGYGLTPQESKLVRESSPMLAKVFEKHVKQVQWDTAFAQPKLDGFRGVARREFLKNGRLGKPIMTSRENQPMPALRQILAALDEVLPRDRPMALDGELFRHGMSLNEISSACKAENDATDRLQYHVYDHASSEDFGARSTDLYGMLSGGPKKIKLVETVRVRNQTELTICESKFLVEGFEGAMLRHGEVGYEAGKRSVHLLKVKQFEDGEFEIIDWKLGRGTYEGVPVFTCVTDDGNTFDVTAPGDMDAKRALGKKADKCVGQHMKIKYAYFTNTAEPVPFQPVAICLLPL